MNLFGSVCNAEEHEKKIMLEKEWQRFCNWVGGREDNEKKTLSNHFPANKICFESFCDLELDSKIAKAENKIKMTFCRRSVIFCMKPLYI